MIFFNAEKAFVYLYDLISTNGYECQDTKAIYNCGFTLKYPDRNLINVKWRNWNKKYADKEWQWYLTKNPNAVEISKSAPIWKKHMNEKNEVNSNYGHQWHRNNQYDKIIEMLKKNNDTRRAVLTLYDGKEIVEYEKDTPCTLNVGFFIKDGYLNMSVMMRSNDLWYGFCNDQYCFSNLQKDIAKEINLPIGEYYHYSMNMHIYNDKLNKV